MKASNTRWSLLLLVGLISYSTDLSAAVLPSDAPAPLQVESHKNEGRQARKEKRLERRLQKRFGQEEQGTEEGKDKLKALLPIIFLGVGVISYPIYYIFGIGLFSLAGLIAGILVRPKLKDKKLRQQAFWGTLLCGLIFGLTAFTISYLSLVFNVW